MNSLLLLCRPPSHVVCGLARLDAAACTAFAAECEWPRSFAACCLIPAKQQRSECSCTRAAAATATAAATAVVLLVCWPAELPEQAEQRTGKSTASSAGQAISKQTVESRWRAQRRRRWQQFAQKSWRRALIPRCAPVVIELAASRACVCPICRRRSPCARALSFVFPCAPAGSRFSGAAARFALAVCLSMT